MDAARLAGQVLCAGFPGTTLPPMLADWLRVGRLGGVILFRRNLPDLASTRSVCREVALAAPDDLPPFVGVDQEGGRVSRLPPPLRALPPFRTLCAGGDAGLVRRAGRAVGAELTALGFNLNFAPVLDVDTNPNNPVIGDRAASSDPREVARLALAFADGLLEAGCIPCGKHFPGHGDTDLDSHLALPRVAHGRARLDAVELLPFLAAARAGLPALMTAHIVVEALDPERPATLSARVCSDLLRGELGFQGVLFSDDLEMRAVSERMSVEELAVLSLEAGCDTLLVCSDLDRLERAHAALERSIRSSPAVAARATEAVERSLALRRRHPPRPAAGADAEHLSVEVDAVLAELGRATPRREGAGG